MKLAIHCANLTWPGGPAAARPDAGRGRPHRRRGRRHHADDDGPLLPDGAPRRPARADARGLHLARVPRRADRATSSSACSSPASPTATPACSPRSSPPSTCSAAAGRCSALGAAWYEREHDGLGVPFPPTSERFERLEETLQICRQMWSDDDGAFEGKHYQLAETVCVPPPIQRRWSADPDRRQRRAEDAAPGREVRRRLQPLRLRARRDGAQDRRARRPLRRRGPRPGRGPAHRARRQRPVRRHRRVPAPDGGVRRPRASSRSG